MFFFYKMKVLCENLMSSPSCGPRQDLKHTGLSVGSAGGT